jgi:RimJ/RimL family protein N-acetyltransferase
MRPEPQRVGPSTTATEGGLRKRLKRHEVFIRGKDDRDYCLRPIEPADAPSVIRGYHALSPRERWFRFLHAIPELTPEFAAAFCSPDPELDICLVIEGQGALAGDIVGGARITGERHRVTGEFSVSMRPEMQGLGLARQALAIAIQAAAEAGYKRIIGHIAPRNSAMLGLAGRLGFTLRTDPDDPAIRLAELRLDDATAT